mgnify:CR=1 FL=1
MAIAPGVLPRQSIRQLIDAGHVTADGAIPDTSIQPAERIALAFAGPGEGKRHGKRHGMHDGKGMARLAEKLNLTDAQKQQMQEQRQNFRASNQHRFEAFRDTRRQYREARQAGDTARAEELKAALELQRGELDQLRDAQHTAMLSILTPEQRTQLEALKAERQEQRKERRERRQSRP